MNKKSGLAVLCQSHYQLPNISHPFSAQPNICCISKARPNGGIRNFRDGVWGWPWLGPGLGLGLGAYVELGRMWNWLRVVDKMRERYDTVNGDGGGGGGGV